MSSTLQGFETDSLLKTVILAVVERAQRVQYGLCMPVAVYEPTTVPCGLSSTIGISPRALRGTK